MNKYILIPLLLIAHVSFAQTAGTLADTAWKKEYRAEAVKINNLVHTKLDVRFDYEKSWMYGKEWLTLTPHLYSTDSVTLDAKAMAIKEIALVNGTSKKSLKYVYDSLTLKIKLDRLYKAGEKYTLFIDYIARPEEVRAQGSAAISDAKGLYFINPHGEEKGKPIQIWTQGETESNSVWMPTIDKPNQKTTQEISMTVPAKYVTLSNGLMTSQKKNADGSRTDTWKMNLPHAPYLFFMGVGDFAVIKDSYKGKEVAYYVEPKYAPVARKIFGATPEMMQFFSKKLGVEYQWPKYSQMVGRKYVSGAMENTTATLHQESAYQSARELLDGNSWEEVIAHELFHHWFGDLVTCESWSNLTVNESFADFSETLWDEYKYGKDKGDEYNYTQLQTYMLSNSDDKDLVRFYYKDKEDMFDAVSYKKGGRILNMLRSYLGEDAFFKSLNKYLEDNKFKTGEAQQLRLAFEEVTGKDLNWFWNQWYYGSGHPVLDINYAYDDAAGVAKVMIRQTQTNKVFRLPLSIDLYNGAVKQRHQVWMNNAADTFSFKYTKRPDLINVDADKILLCEKTDRKTAANFVAQIKSAPLYLDRREALEYFSKNKMPELALGLKDSYAGLRGYTIDKIGKDSSMMKNADVIRTVEKLAQADPDNKVKGKSLMLLALTKNAQYKPLFERYLNDSSYTVAAAALYGMVIHDTANALSLVRKMAPQAGGDMNSIILYAVMQYGEDKDFDLLWSAFDSMPLDDTKVFSLFSVLKFLGGVKDSGILKSGISKVYEFGKSIGGANGDYLQSLIKTSLEQMSKEKGGDVAVFINSLVK